MLKSRYFLASFFVLVLVAILHWIASDTRFDFYYTVGWYDIMMHFLGGAWVALFGLWTVDSFSHYFGGLERFKPFINLRNILLFTIAVGIAWEIFELLMQFTATSMPNYWPDTILDLIMDTLGAFVISKIYVR